MIVLDIELWVQLLLKNAENCAFPTSRIRYELIINYLYITKAIKLNESDLTMIWQSVF